MYKQQVTRVDIKEEMKDHFLSNKESRMSNFKRFRELDEGKRGLVQKVNSSYQLDLVKDIVRNIGELLFTSKYQNSKSNDDKKVNGVDGKKDKMGKNQKDKNRSNKLKDSNVTVEDEKKEEVKEEIKDKEDVTEYICEDGNYNVSKQEIIDLIKDVEGNFEKMIDQLVLQNNGFTINNDLTHPRISGHPLTVTPEVMDDPFRENAIKPPNNNYLYNLCKETNTDCKIEGSYDTVGNEKDHFLPKQITLSNKLFAENSEGKREKVIQVGGIDIKKLSPSDFRRKFFIAPSGSGKTFYTKIFSEVLIDADTIFKWPTLSQNKDCWMFQGEIISYNIFAKRWFDDDLIRKIVDAKNSIILETWLNEKDESGTNITDGKVILYADDFGRPELVSGVVLIGEKKHQENLRNDRPGQPDISDWEKIKTQRINLLYRYQGKIFPAFEQIIPYSSRYTFLTPYVVLVSQCLVYIRIADLTE